jgi:hypothetical protein
MKKKIILGYFINFLLVFSGITALVAIKTDYIPSFNAIFAGVVVGIVLFFILLYEIFTYKKNSVTTVMNHGVVYRLYYFGLCIAAFICFGVYGVSHFLHSITSEEYVVKEVAYLAPPTGTKFFQCDTRVTVVGLNSKSYCVSKQEYGFVSSSLKLKNNKRGTIFYVIYRKSFFGRKFVKLKLI